MSPRDESHIQNAFTPLQNMSLNHKSNSLIQRQKPTIHLSLNAQHVLVCQIPVSIPLLGTYLYSIGTHHRNLLKSLVAVSRVTYFILWAHIKNHVRDKFIKQLKRGRIWKQWWWMNWEEFPGSRQSMHAWLYSGLLQALKGEYLLALGS